MTSQCLALACGALAATLALAPTARAQPTPSHVDQPAPPAPAAPPPPEPRSVVPAVVLGVLAAGGIGSGIGFLMLSASRYSASLAVVANIKAAHGGCVYSYSDYDSLCPLYYANLNSANAYQDVATGAFLAGGAAAAATVLYLLWPHLRLTPVLGPTTGLLVAGSF